MKREPPAVPATLRAGAENLLHQVQDRLLFPAPSMDVEELDLLAAQTGARVLSLLSEDGVHLYGWHRPARGERALLLFHGNAETVADRIPLHDLLVSQGWDVLLVAYRGYPGSEGQASEEGLGRDAMALWAHATGPLGLPASRLVLHGKSLGGGVAALLAERVGPAALVLESTFLSVVEVARGRFPLLPVDGWVRNRFETRARAPRITCPVLVLHGDLDLTVPVRHGRELAPLFPNSRYLECAGLAHGESLPLVDPQAREAWLALLDDAATAER